LLNTIRIGDKPIEFKLLVDEKLPLKLFGDELRIKQILNNILSNAIKYTKEGFVKFKVDHTRMDNHVLLRFSIDDSGQGIKEEDQKKLFTEFVRFDAKNNYRTEGTGLGLSITKNLIDMMGGKIEVISEYGVGSTFIVTIKQKIANSEPIGALIVEQLCDFKRIKRLRSGEAGFEPKPMPHGRVLVVDDMKTNIKVASGLLSKYKLNIDSALSGNEVIDKITNGSRYDVIFMDHMMPDMNGIEATQVLRKSGYTGTIVALTANAIVGTEEKFLEKGFDGFISKPIDLKKLDEILNKYI